MSTQCLLNWQKCNVLKFKLKFFILGLFSANVDIQYVLACVINLIKIFNEIDNVLANKLLFKRLASVRFISFIFLKKLILLLSKNI